MISATVNRRFSHARYYAFLAFYYQMNTNIKFYNNF
jgi:hypothetical protein